MPIYEYQCKACQHAFEELKKISDPDVRKCPACGKMKVERLVSAAGFQLKGTGWYETDFKHKDKPKNDSKAKDTGESNSTPETVKKQETSYDGKSTQKETT